MSVTFINELIENYYEELDLNYGTTFLRGQIFWTYVYYDIREDLRIWRPVQLDDTNTSANEFKIEHAGKDAFKRKNPLTFPKLQTDEEFPVVIAKKRPVILLTPSPPLINDVFPIRGGGKINRNLCLVAPLYSIINKISGQTKYIQEFVDRIRKLKYPHLFYIPENIAYGIRDSIGRFDSIQAAFQSQLEATRLKFNDEFLEVFEGQLEYFLTGIFKEDNAYLGYRKELLNP